jgi:type IV secretory pathway VirB2 component (pilin)
MNDSTPLILTFDNGEQVSVTDAKSVVGARHQDRYSHCAIVRGQKGAAFCHPSEDVLVNGAPSSVHWLQPGDRIQFGNSATATVEQLGRLNDAISELKQAFSPATQAVAPQSPALADPTPTASEPTSVAPTFVESPETQSVEPEVTQTAATQEPLSDFASQLLQSISDESPTDTFEVADQPTETIAGFDAATSVSEPEPQAAEPSATFAASDSPEIAASVETPVEPEPAEVNDSVSAILERMKLEGNWDDASEADEASQPIEPAQPAATAETQPANAPKAECDEDVESYMSQLLTRMRGGEPAPEPVKQEAAPEEPTAEETPEPVEQPSTNPLKPEEFVPKTKARRADTWQQMRELSNISSQAAINSSDAKKKQESQGSLQTTIGACCAIAAFCIWATSLLGPLSATIAIAIVISAGFTLYKTFVLDVPKQKVAVTVTPIPTTSAEAVEVQN